jgi:2-C-methyl-D-erythritol 4-phosphate cytidylyltransferase
MDDFDHDASLPLGVVVEHDRGSLPFALLHGEALVTCAAWAMGEAGVRLLDPSTGSGRRLGTPWQDVVDSSAPLVWHDALCPMTPPEFLTACVERARADDVVVVGVLPVTDTVKEVLDEAEGPVVGATVDRDRLVQIASPIVLPPVVVGAIGGWPSADFPTALAELGRVGRVVFVDAPSEARRVSSEDDVRALDALTRR